jgi:hypothetical protein
MDLWYWTQTKVTALLAFGLSRDGTSGKLIKSCSRIVLDSSRELVIVARTPHLLRESWFPGPENRSLLLSIL